MKNDEIIDKMVKGMGSFLSTKTVVGEPINLGDTLILPLVEVSFGLAAGTGEDDKKGKTGGGIGGRMTPSAVLVIKNGNARLVNIKNQDAVTKILDMVPEMIGKFTEDKSAEREDLSNAEAIDIAFDKTENN
ncbi:MAG: GerW family sporulation protein [Lachnospiraceae bacterium]|nr:GerW family sporulation protein [Lachnospiraceae bacterium]MDN4743492.1 GerW family sporulation protein [Lachnospiraceae bacterium C1.1]